MKLMTPLGEISVRIDGREIPYTFRKWDNYGSCEDLDGRYSIEIVFEPDGLEHIIACCLRPNQKIDYGQDSGERLICKSFYSEDEKIKLSIGTYGDNRYIYDKEGKLVRASEFDYDNGFSAEAGEYALTYELLPDTRTRQFWFGIAWLENCTEENEHHTWYGVGTWYDIMKERSGNR